MSEMIDRQETIKEFCKQDCGCDPKDCPNKTCYEVEIIESMPSVQPKIIRCKDCKWFNKPGCSIWIVDDSDKPSEDDYCSFAELRGDSDD